MGVYYKWVCPSRREHLDPEWFGESDKTPWEGIITSRALTLLCSHGTWRGRPVELVCDADSSDYYFSPTCSLKGDDWRDDVKDEALRLVREFSPRAGEGEAGSGPT